MKKILLLAVGAICSFVLGYGVLGEAYPAGGMYGRDENRGYFTNAHDTQGTFVLPKQYTGNTNAIDPSVNNATELINFLKGSEGLGGSTQQRTGAAFIIQTMIGSSRNRPPTAAQIADWESRVRYAESQGHISWFVSYSFCINTYWQGTNGGGAEPNDDAFFDDCGTDTSIVFRNPNGSIAYVIKRECANPVGNVAPIYDPPSFTMSGNTTITNSTNAARGANPLPGDSIVFHHYVRNCAAPCGGTSPTNIWWIAQSMPSQTTVGGAANSGTYATGQQKNVFNHTVNIPGSALPGTQYCERVGYDPTNGSGGSDGRGPTVCATVAYDFGLVPSVNPVVFHDGVAITGDFAEPGDTIQFTYAVNNTGLTQSQSTTCTYRQATWPGNNEAAPTTVFTPGGANCPPNRVFPRGNTVTVTENVPASAINTTICRSLTVSPATETGGTAADQACVKVAAKPYTRVWGGDVSAGNGLANSSGVCSANTNAAIVSWNRRDVGSNAGAGTQFAAFALARITDFATALYDPGGAPSPNGLSFANQPTNPSVGDFGGDFGNVPCIRDYYGARPASVLPLPANITSMVSGVYGATGNTYFSAGPTNNINAGEKITVYIDGNVYINTNIVYAGTWTSSNIPSFRLVVRGNIYIDLNMNQLDGTFIAQPRADGSGGEIYTCASTTDMYAALPGNRLFNECNRKLVVNGSLIAKQIRLMRTSGTLSQAVTDETNLATQAAEVFNYGPAAWIPQQAGDPSDTPDYDAIISLPPVL